MYCDSIFDVFIIDHYNLAECPKYDYLCSMFHSESDKKTKNKKFSYLENPQSDLRIIYTTSARHGIGHSRVSFTFSQWTSTNNSNLIQGISRIVRQKYIMCCIAAQFTCIYWYWWEMCYSLLSCRRLSIMKYFQKDSELQEIYEDMEIQPKH